MTKYLVEFVTNSSEHRIVQGAVEIYAMTNADAAFICQLLMLPTKIEILNITVPAAIIA